MLKGRNMNRRLLNNDDGAENPNKCPECLHQVACLRQLAVTVAKHAGNGIRKMFPWRRWNDAIQVAVNVEIQRPVVHAEMRTACRPNTCEGGCGRSEVKGQRSKGKKKGPCMDMNWE